MVGSGGADLRGYLIPKICGPGTAIPMQARPFHAAYDEEELADWRAGRNAVYQLAALTIGVRLAVADA